MFLNMTTGRAGKVAETLITNTLLLEGVNSDMIHLCIIRIFVNATM
jgi:hypothetical protein